MRAKYYGVPLKKKKASAKGLAAYAELQRLQ